MTVDMKKLPKSQAELTITVPYEVYAAAEKEALKRLNEQMKIDGFRSGHIPEPLLRERLGLETIQEATLEHLLPKVYAKAVQEKDLPVVAPPQIEIKNPVLKQGDELVFVARVAVMPEVKIDNYKKIKIRRSKPAIQPKQIDETIEMILDRFAEWKEAARKAQAGDRVEVDFEGFDKEGKAVPTAASKNHPLILGSKVMVPGFEEALVGLGPAETKEFDIVFPKTYHKVDMQGQTVHFKATVNRVQEKIKKALDETLVEKITGVKKTPAEFRKTVEADLLAEMARRAEDEHQNKVIEAIIKITHVDLPDALLLEEKEMILDEKKRQVESQGLSWEQYLQHIRKTEEDLHKEHEPLADQRLKARLGIQHIIKEAALVISDDEVDQKISQLATSYPPEQVKHYREHYKKESDPYRELRHRLLIDKLMEMMSE